MKAKWPVVSWMRGEPVSHEPQPMAANCVCDAAEVLLWVGHLAMWSRRGSEP
jgi:hypothetical protein